MRGKCRPCYRYYKDKGVERPLELAVKMATCRPEHCSNKHCNAPFPRSGRANRLLKGRCNNCHRYFEEHGVERSKELVDKTAAERPEFCLNEACKVSFSDTVKCQNGRSMPCYDEATTTLEQRRASGDLIMRKLSRALGVERQARASKLPPRGDGGGPVGCFFAPGIQDGRRWIMEETQRAAVSSYYHQGTLPKERRPQLCVERRLEAVMFSDLRSLLKLERTAGGENSRAGCCGARQEEEASCFTPALFKFYPQPTPSTICRSL